MLVYGSLTSHISGDMHLNPGAELSDGLLHLHVIRAGVTRSQVLQVSRTGRPAGRRRCAACQTSSPVPSWCQPSCRT